MKKYIWIFSFFILSCALFHKAILSFAIRAALKQQSGCELAYRAMEWDEGDLVFSDVVVFDSTFHVHMEKAYFRLDWRSLPHKLRGLLIIDRPRLSFLKMRNWPAEKNNWLDITVSVNDGIVEWNGLARFSYDQNHLMLDWDGSGLDLFFYEEQTEAEFKQFNLSLLNPFLPSGEILAGFLTGRASIDGEQNLVSANLKLQDVAAKASLASICSTEGAFSYNADLGAKWELKGTGHVQDREFPFACEGRGFFKSRWIESEVRFDESICSISGEDVWTLQCKKLRAPHATLLQAGASLAWPKAAEWKFLEGQLSAEASFCPSFWNLQFEGQDLLFSKEGIELKCEKATGKLSQDGGEASIISSDYALTASGSFDDWQMQLHAFSGDFHIQGGWDGEKFPLRIAKAHLGAFDFTGHGWVDSQFDWRFSLDGDLTVLERKIPFSCSNLSKQADGVAFDFRLDRKTWDLCRLKGIYDGKEVRFDPKSHLLGSALQFGFCNLHTLDASVEIPWKNIRSASSCFKEWGMDLSAIPKEPNIGFHFSYRGNQAEISAEAKEPHFKFTARQEIDAWKVKLDSELFVDATIRKDGQVRGYSSWKNSKTQFEGRIGSQFQADLALNDVSFDLSQIPFYKLEGIVKGRGHIVYGDFLEADFDLEPPSLKVHDLPLENGGEVHLHYSSEKGAIFSGINIHGPFGCEVELLEYDANRSHWLFHNASVHLPGAFLTGKLSQFLDKSRDLDFIADLDFASDFSSFTCSMTQALIPFDGTSYPIEQLQVVWENDLCTASFRYLKQLVRTALHIDEAILGKVIIGEEETPLSIDFLYDKTLHVHSLEGSFAGVEATFHADSPNTLIGSAHVNFATLSHFLPAKLAEVFTDIKMGKGYELKGKLKVENGEPSFEGLLAGKQLELFGFQFRTLLSQVSLSSSLVHLYDLKISDTAGMMKIDHIRIEGKQDNPWTIEIPNLSMHELRPSLLQKPGGPPGTISPLVVRELTVSNFKGLLDESSTYTAEGKLHFINSYKREETVFDVPANVLNRIVGLDFELLIPVCGDLAFDLKDGAFHLLDLTNAFSEANRSQFFLEMDPPPQMDLDGNLKIFIKMKQFVLLKITESFLISVDGKLDDPKYHLKKRRFFGLM